MIYKNYVKVELKMLHADQQFHPMQAGHMWDGQWRFSGALILLHITVLLANCYRLIQLLCNHFICLVISVGFYSQTVFH